MMTVGLPMMMRNKEEIEWKDRSWRLLENKGQLEVDDWSYLGMVGGLGTMIMRGEKMGLGWRGAVGGMGVGGLVGVVGYIGWRYGVKGGKWQEEKES